MISIDRIISLISSLDIINKIFNVALAISGNSLEY